MLSFSVNEKQNENVISEEKEVIYILNKGN
jgi:hypothetical protein